MICVSFFSAFINCSATPVRITAIPRKWTGLIDSPSINDMKSRLTKGVTNVRLDTRLTGVSLRLKEFDGLYLLC